MPIETFQYIDSLDTANPPSTDGLVGADDHLRGIKSTIKASFPQITGVASVTHTTLSLLGSGSVLFASGSAGTPSARFADEPTLGLYRASAGVIGFTGRLSGNGAVPTGAILDFPTTAIPTGWYELNGQAVPRTGETAGLFALFSTAHGAGDGVNTFNLPNYDTRYRRARGSGLAVGTLQGDAIKSHTHAASASAAGDHNHTGSTAVTGAHRHHVMSAEGGTVVSPPLTAYNFLVYGASVGTDWSWSVYGSAAEPSAGLSSLVGDHAHGIYASGDHTHTVTVTAFGDTETRPKSIVVVTCIKA